MEDMLGKDIKSSAGKHITIRIFSWDLNVHLMFALSNISFPSLNTKASLNNYVNVNDLIEINDCHIILSMINKNNMRALESSALEQNWQHQSLGCLPFMGLFGMNPFERPKSEHDRELCPSPAKEKQKHITLSASVQ